jgi:hypothetical protein
MDTVLLPSLMKHEKLRTKMQFADVHPLKTWVSVQQAQRTLWHVPAVRDLMLTVTSADESGAVLPIVVKTLPHLRALGLVFQQRFSLVRARDLLQLRRFRGPAHLEVRTSLTRRRVARPTRSRRASGRLSAPVCRARNGLCFR